MGGGNAPALCKTHPQLRLTALNQTAVRGALEFKTDVTHVVAEGEYIESDDIAGQVGGAAVPAEGRDFIKTVQILGDAKASRER